MRDYRRVQWQATIVAVCSVAAVLGLYWFYVRTLPGRRLDSKAFASAEFGRSHLLSLANTALAGIATIAIIVAIGIMIIAFARRRYRVAAASILVVAGANATTQLLKAGIFGRPTIGFEDYFPISLPSGHTTVAASISLAILIAVPVAWRWWVSAIGATLTFVIGWSTVVSGWHRPSDIVAAIFVALAWAAAVIAIGGGSVVAPTEVPGTAVSRRLQFTAKLSTEVWLRRVWIIFVVCAGGGMAISFIAQLIEFPHLAGDIGSYERIVNYIGSVAGYGGVVCGATGVLLALIEGPSLRQRRENVPDHPLSG